MNGYFVHYFAPSEMPVFPKNIIFVIDKSGSMIGNKIRQVISPKTEPFLESTDSFCCMPSLIPMKIILFQQASLRYSQPLLSFIAVNQERTIMC